MTKETIAACNTVTLNNIKMIIC